MIRSSRQSRILELIAQDDIETQEELARLLIASGYNVTQATVSRDIKELGLVKVLADSGVYRYASIKDVDVKVSSKLINVFRETVIGVFCINNDVVVKVVEGSTQIVSSIIGQLSIQQIVGKVEGADTVLIITHREQDAKQVQDKLDSLLK
ncbi:MAG: arginine repressor [Clostridia bacterium]|nr:arginine repressor [Clostridia bacterium]